MSITTLWRWRLAGVVLLLPRLWQWTRIGACYDINGHLEPLTWRLSLAWIMWRHRYCWVPRCEVWTTAARCGEGT